MRVQRPPRGALCGACGETFPNIWAQKRHVDEVHSVTVVDEGDEHTHLLEMFDADAIVHAPCPNCAQQANVATRGDGLAVETVGLACPWCQHVEFLDEEGVIGGDVD